MGTLSKTVRFSLYPSQWVRNWCDYLDLTSLKFLMLWFVMIFQGIFMVFLWFLVGFYGFSFFLSFPPSMMGFFTKPSGPMFWASLTIVFPMVAKHRSSDAMFAMYRWRLPSGDQLARRYRNAMRCLRCIAQVCRLMTNWQGDIAMRCNVCDVSLKSTVWWPIGRAISRCDAMLRCIAQVYHLVTNWQGDIAMRCDVRDVSLKSTVWWPIGRAAPMVSLLAAAHSMK